MKTHYCQAEKTTIEFEGECNWCDEKENIMKIDLEIDGSDYMCSMFEAVTVQNLKWDLLAWETTGYVHPSDIKEHNKRIEAAKVLIKWYSGEGDD